MNYETYVKELTPNKFTAYVCEENAIWNSDSHLLNLEDAITEYDSIDFDNESFVIGVGVANSKENALIEASMDLGKQL
jgi:hypothetical protein